ncbi:MAG: hypothetical protein QGM47_06590 [Actinomycetota bacterium]|nr:hypothetical protein [Actinomycetota bacterium]
MKRILPLFIAAAMAAIAIVKLREPTPLPEQPAGSWDLTEDDPIT